MTELYITFDAGKVISGLARQRLLEMEAAGQDIAECYRVLQRASQNLVGQCLAHQGEFFELDHYPKGDVYDSVSHGQYYYHAHRPESGEHGHFHTFLRTKGMPKGIEPAPYSGTAKRQLGKDALAHFVAISMDGPGFPIGLFTTNRWVTDETYYTATDTIAILDRFEIDHTYPCLAVNRWISAMLKLFRPQIKVLLQERDKTMRSWAASHPGVDIYEDRDLEITSIMNIDVDQQVALVQAALGHERKSA